MVRWEAVVKSMKKTYFDYTAVRLNFRGYFGSGLQTTAGNQPATAVENRKPVKCNHVATVLRATVIKRTKKRDSQIKVTGILAFLLAR